MKPNWKDDPNSSSLNFRVPGDTLVPGNACGATVVQPDLEDLKRPNWSTELHFESEGKSLSLESGKVDAVMALRRDIERFATLLGGTVTWRD